MSDYVDNLVVFRKETEGDRVLLYPRAGKFHVIASPAAAETVQPGDRIRYEVGGMNFGWFVKKEVQ